VDLLHGDKMSSYKKKITFITTDEINRMYEEDEFIPYIIFGGLGYGKSSYAIQCVATAYGTPEEPNWKEALKRIIFTPEEFVELMRKKRNKRDKVIIWDDAGVWLYSLDYYTPLIKAITKYLSVARTDFATILFTTPDPDWIVKKGRTMTNTRLVRIVKHATVEHTTKNGEKMFYRYRTAIVYQTWRSPDGKKYGAKRIYTDDFNANLPDEFFKQYRPIRDKYAKIVKDMITDELFKERYKEKLSKVIGKAEEKIEDKKEEILT